MEKITLPVRGMSCASCSNTVEKTLASLKGMQSVTVSLTEELAYITYNEKLLSVDKMAKAVKKAGFELVTEKNDTKQKKHAEFTLTRIVLSVCTALPLFILKDRVPVLSLIICLLSIAVNRSFFIKGFKTLFTLHPNMDSLIAIGCSSSFIFSITNLIKGTPELYFDSVAVIMTLVDIGKYAEYNTRQKAHNAIDSLNNLIPKTATAVIDSAEQTISVNDITADMILVVKKGETVPCDAVVIRGKAEADESALTGESTPSLKETESPVFCGTVITEGTVYIRATGNGENMLISKIARMTNEAKMSKPPITRLADNVAGYFVPVVLTISLLTFALWAVTTKDVLIALKYAVSVLVISCPCSLGLATPIAISIAQAKSAKKGIVFKDSAVLENISKMKNIFFDKTGTITTGKGRIVSYTNEETIELAAIAEQDISHPFAKAITDYRSPAEKPVEKEYIPGKGIICKCSKGTVYVGNRLLFEENSIYIPEDSNASVYVALNGQYTGKIEITDAVRAESRRTADKLQKEGLNVFMLTGDNEEKAEAAAKEAGITNFHAHLLPQDKYKIIEETPDCIMVGDGINDSPALQKSNIGIAMGTATEIAADSADIIILNNNLMNIPYFIELSKKTRKNIKRSLFFAFFYNILAIPAAAGALNFAGIAGLNPMLCALCMSVSSLCVTFNALTLTKERNENELAIIGGTFDPVHIGHLHLFHTALEETDYKKILIIPANINNFKQNSASVATAEQRISMLELALQDFKQMYPQDNFDRLEICSAEIEKGGVSYTYETVKELKRKYKIQSKIGIITGDDIVKDLSKWYKFKKLRKIASFVFIRREDKCQWPLIPSRTDVKTINREILSMSSTQIRQDRSKGLSPRVYEYVEKNGLYK